ncbi:unnamed protein product [Heterobilharzia americana]|nr:unnamed protein product [Heterobilharzia americana]
MDSGTLSISYSCHENDNHFDHNKTNNNNHANNPNILVKHKYPFPNDSQTSNKFNDQSFPLNLGHTADALIIDDTDNFALNNTDNNILNSYPISSKNSRFICNVNTIHDLPFSVNDYHITEEICQGDLDYPNDKDEYERDNDICDNCIRSNHTSTTNNNNSMIMDDITIIIASIKSEF